MSLTIPIQPSPQENMQTQNATKTYIKCLFDTSLLPSFARCTKFSNPLNYPPLPDREYYELLDSSHDNVHRCRHYIRKHDTAYLHHYCRALCLRLFLTDIVAVPLELDQLFSLRVFLHCVFMTRYPKMLLFLSTFWEDFEFYWSFDSLQSIQDLRSILGRGSLPFVSKDIRQLIESREGIIPTPSKFNAMSISPLPRFAYGSSCVLDSSVMGSGKKLERQPNSEDYLEHDTSPAHYESWKINENGGASVGFFEKPMPVYRDTDSELHTCCPSEEARERFESYLSQFDLSTHPGFSADFEDELEPTISSMQRTMEEGRQLIEKMQRKIKEEYGPGSKLGISLTRTPVAGRCRGSTLPGRDCPNFDDPCWAVSDPDYMPLTRQASPVKPQYYTPPPLKITGLLCRELTCGGRQQITNMLNLNYTMSQDDELEEEEVEEVD